MSTSSKKKKLIISISFFILIFFIISCGLPDIETLDPPIPVDSNDTSLSFITPAQSGLIQGYVIYYKIYPDSDNQSDRTVFDPGTYLTSFMPVGATLLRRQGFIKAGYVGVDSNSSVIFHIPNSGLNPSTTITIEFDDINDTPPTILIPGSGNVADGRELTRGVNDPNASSGVENFLSFIDDWDFDITDPDEHVDADLLKKTNLPGTSTISELVEILTNNDPDPILDITASELYIGFVVYSYGVDTLARPLESTPVYLGLLDYSPLADIDRSRN